MENSLAFNLVKPDGIIVMVEAADLLENKIAQRATPPGWLGRCWLRFAGEE